LVATAVAVAGIPLAVVERLNLSEVSAEIAVPFVATRVSVRRTGVIGTNAEPVPLFPV
jgi:hypothetical protein